MSQSILEPIPIIDVYADGISHVENLGNCFRTVYFTWSRYGDRQERLVVAKLVRPMHSLLNPSMLRRMVEAEPPLGMVSRLAAH